MHPKITLSINLFRHNIFRPAWVLSCLLLRYKIKTDSLFQAFDKDYAPRMHRDGKYRTFSTFLPMQPLRNIITPMRVRETRLPVLCHFVPLAYVHADLS